MLLCGYVLVRSRPRLISQPGQPTARPAVKMNREDVIGDTGHYFQHRANELTCNTHKRAFYL